MPFKQRYENWLSLLSKRPEAEDFCKNFQVLEGRISSLRLKSDALSFMKKQSGIHKMILRMGLHNEAPDGANINFAPYLDFYESKEGKSESLDFEFPFVPIKGRSKDFHLPVGVVINRDFANTLIDNWNHLNCTELRDSFYDKSEPSKFLRLYYLDKHENPILTGLFRHLFKKDLIGELENLNIHLGFKAKSGTCKEEFPFGFCMLVEFDFKSEKATNAVYKEFKLLLNRYPIPEDCKPMIPEEAPEDNKLFFQYMRPCPPFCNNTGLL